MALFVLAWKADEAELTTAPRTLLGNLNHYYNGLNRKKHRLMFEGIILFLKPPLLRRR